MNKEESIEFLDRLLKEMQSMTAEQYAQRIKNLKIDESLINPDDYYTASTDDGSITTKPPKFLPCPRCGSNNIKCEKWFDKPGDMYPSYQCRCEKDHAWDDVYDDEEKAIAAWNERPVCVYTMVSAEYPGE